MKLLSNTINDAIKTEEIEKTGGLLEKLKQKIGDLEPHELIYIARKRLNLKQYDITRKIGLPQTRVSGIEKGLPTSTDELVSIVEVLLETGDDK